MSDSEVIVVADDNHNDHVFPNNNNHISSAKCDCHPFWNSGTMEWIHDNRFGLVPSRIDVIGQNGNDGDHYQVTEENFDQLTPEQLRNSGAIKIKPTDKNGNRLLTEDEFDEAIKKAIDEVYDVNQERYIGGDHYQNMAIEPMEIIETWPIDQRIGFLRGNALKYTMRIGLKDSSVDDAKKAAFYSKKLAQLIGDADA